MSDGRYGSIFFKAVGRNGEFLKPILILSSEDCKKATEQFEGLVNKIPGNGKQSIEDDPRGVLDLSDSTLPGDALPAALG